MSGPLAGIRVVDLTAMFSGPVATALLGDQGADVVKVEPPGAGDLIRRIGASRGGISAIFQSVNRNKRSIVLDLRQAPGREILLDLVRTADVFVQNFRPGVMERMGLGEPALRAVRPDLVYVSVSAFGETGPYAARPAFDSNVQAVSGMAAHQADPETGAPGLIQHVVCDKASALYVAQAITAALFARERGAGGQHVRIAMLDAAIAFLWPDAMQSHTYLGEGVRASAAHAGLMAVRPTRDGFVTISMVSDAQFERACRALRLPELATDERFAAVESRMQNLRALGDLVSERTRAFATDELCARLEAEDVPHARVNALESLHEDPQVVENGLLVEMEHPTSGRLRMPRPVPRFAATPADMRLPAPALGEHTDEILAELGHGAGAIAVLRKSGVVA